MSSELGTSIGPMIKLFVSYDAVTAATERFCKNAEIRSNRTGWRQPDGRARQEQLVGGQVGPASRKPCTRAPSFGPGLNVALRPLPPETRLRCSSLLGHAILFFGLHDGIPAATSPETKLKICRLDVLPSADQISGSNLPQPCVSWPALWGF